MALSKDLAVKALNRFLSEWMDPAPEARFARLDEAQALKWLKNSRMPSAMRAAATELLRPVAGKPGVRFIRVEQASLRDPKRAGDVMVVGISAALRDAVQGMAVLVLTEQPSAAQDPGQPQAPVIETCRRMKCIVASPTNCSCLSALSFKDGKQPCPADECKTSLDCCGGSSDAGGGESGGGALEDVMGAF